MSIKNNLIVVFGSSKQRGAQKEIKFKCIFI
jgi:hypothetical protein